jgi:hypothetical protein
LQRCEGDSRLQGHQEGGRGRWYVRLQYRSKTLIRLLEL